MIILQSKVFIKNLKRLPARMQRQAVQRLLIMREDEFHTVLNNHPLTGEFLGCRSINVTGDYRIIYKRINPDTIFLQTIGAHHQLYGK